jgi:hypothetical protein
MDNRSPIHNFDRLCQVLRTLYDGIDVSVRYESTIPFQLHQMRKLSSAKTRKLLPHYLQYPHINRMMYEMIFEANDFCPLIATQNVIVLGPPLVEDYPLDLVTNNKRMLRKHYDENCVVFSTEDRTEMIRDCASFIMSKREPISKVQDDYAVRAIMTLIFSSDWAEKLKPHLLVSLGRTGSERVVEDATTSINILL